MTVIEPLTTDQLAELQMLTRPITGQIAPRALDAALQVVVARSAAWAFRWADLALSGDTGNSTHEMTGRAAMRGAQSMAETRLAQVKSRELDRFSVDVEERKASRLLDELEPNADVELLFERTIELTSRATPEQLQSLGVTHPAFTTDRYENVLSLAEGRNIDSRRMTPSEAQRALLTSESRGLI